ncbi:MAG: hypothetical protein QXF76_03530 [Candidatus Anstonellales archaeon]
MKSYKKTRRQFLLSLGSLAALPIISKCTNPVTPEQINSYLSSRSSNNPNPDLLISGSETQIADKIKRQFPLIESLAKNIGTAKSIGYYDGGDYKELTISIVKDKLASYPHLKIVKKETNETVHILFGMKGIYPSIKFVDDNGNLIVRNNQGMEFALKKTESRKYSSIDWLNLGIKVFAFGLLIWLGASILKYVISAIAFISFNALVLGIVIAGLSLIIPFIKWLLNTTGWTVNDVKYWFNRTINEIVRLFMDIQNYLLQR